MMGVVKVHGKVCHSVFSPMQLQKEINHDGSIRLVTPAPLLQMW